VTVGYRLSNAALKDLAVTYRYTREKFGKAQAETYIAELKLTLDAIADHPSIGPEHSEFNPPIRIHPHREHVILYLVEGPSPFIVRIVPSRSDWRARQ
jgi:toxin ParE1/3/4